MWRRFKNESLTTGSNEMTGAAWSNSDIWIHFVLVNLWTLIFQRFHGCRTIGLQLVTLLVYLFHDILGFMLVTGVYFLHWTCGNFVAFEFFSPNDPEPPLRCLLSFWRRIGAKPSAGRFWRLDFWRFGWRSCRVVSWLAGNQPVSNKKYI